MKARIGIYFLLLGGFSLFLFVASLDVGAFRLRYLLPGVLLTAWGG